MDHGQRNLLPNDDQVDPRGGPTEIKFELLVIVAKARDV